MELINVYLYIILIQNRIKSYKENNQLDVDYDDQQMIMNQTQQQQQQYKGENGDNNDAKTLQELVKFKNENEELNVYIILLLLNRIKSRY